MSGMSSEKVKNQFYLEPQPIGSDNEKTLNYSSKNEYSNFNENYQLNKIENRTSNHTLDVKIEQTMPSLTSSDMEVSDIKKKPLFKCGLCPKVFSNSSAIAKHKLTHSDERKYVCETCGKAFKRQDHLNGHKHTHNTNKPHACHLCDRSYSDARSLRRHYENQHQNEVLRCKEQKVGRDSCGSSSVDESSCPGEVFGFLDETKCIKCDVCTKAFKNQSALNGHMRLHGGYGQTKNCITGPGELRQMAQLVAYSPERNEAPSSPVPASRSNRSTTVTNSQLHSLLTTSVAQHPVPLYNHDESGISMSILATQNASNINMSELCACLSPSSNHNRNVLTSSCTIVDASNSSSLNSNISDTVDNHYSPITPAFTNHGHTTSINLPDPHMFNYPTVVDGNHLSFDPGNQPSQYQYNWDSPKPHSTYTSPNEKQLSYYDLPSDLPNNKSSNASSLPQISSSNNLQDLIMNLEFIDPCNNLDADWCKNYYENDDNNLTVESSETESIVKKEMVDTVVDTQTCDYSQTIGNENHVSPIYKQSPNADSSMSHRRIKSRPDPICIPPQTSAHMSRLRSPRFWNTSDRDESKIPPYTPPPMLSPQRKGSGLFTCVWNSNRRSSGNLSASIGPWSASFVNNTVMGVPSCYANDTVVSASEVMYSDVNNHISPMWFKEPVRNGEPEQFIYQEDYLDYPPHSVEDIDGLPTSATPQINIGPQYQAQLPLYNNDKKQAREDRRVWDVLLWDPKQFKDTLENTSSLDLLMKIASSPAVKSCGLNMEYTFHLLCKFKGDLEKTLQALLEDSFGVYDYVYAETTIWTTDEINKFQERLKKYDRDFMRVALDLQSCGMNKSVKACVEFYYVWKQMNNVKDINRFLVKSSRKKLLVANNNAVRYGDSCDTNIEDLSSAQVAAESGYYLRKRYHSANQKPCMPYNSYFAKTSSDSSSTESGPAYCKPHRIGSSFYAERVKKPQSYHCSQCKRKFTKSKALDNHMRSHNGTNIIHDRRWLR